MRKHQTPEEEQHRREEKLARATAEAEQLQAIVALHEMRGAGWSEAQAEVGLVMPHATFHQHLARWRQNGVAGLVDHRHRPASCITDEIRGVIVGLALAQPPRNVSTTLRQSPVEFKLRNRWTAASKSVAC